MTSVRRSSVALALRRFNELSTVSFSFFFRSLISIVLHFFPHCVHHDRFISFYFLFSSFVFILCDTPESAIARRVVVHSTDSLYEPSGYEVLLNTCTNLLEDPRFSTIHRFRRRDRSASSRRRHILSYLLAYSQNYNSSKSSNFPKFLYFPNSSTFPKLLTSPKFHVFRNARIYRNA